MKYETVVTGGQLVLPTGVVEADIGIIGERIAAVGAKGTFSDANETLDVTGLHVFPGLIDPHTHPGNLRPFELDMEQETWAAAAGGMTAMLSTVKCTRLGQPFKAITTEADVCSYQEVFGLARDIINSRAAVDVGFSYVMMDDRHAAEIPLYVKEHGVLSFKFFVGNRGVAPHGGRIGIPQFGDDGVNFSGFQRAAETGSLAMVHAEDQQVARALQRAMAEAPATLHTWEAHSPGWAEAETIARALAFSAVTGVRLYLVHLNSREGVAATAQAKADRPGRVFSETCPQYLVLHVDHPSGLMAKCSPPVRTPADNEALWRALEKGTIDAVGTDHIPQPLSEKLKAGDVWGTAAGVPGQETLLPLMLSAHRLSLPRVAEVTSSNAAKIFGLWPHKGCIGVGFDADLTFVDLSKRRAVHAADLITSADFTPYEGMELTGWPQMTMLRGHVVFADRKRQGKAIGRYLSRQPQDGAQ